MTYAKGTRSLAICDRCGWAYPYLSMRVEWNNLKVCPECYEPRQPQDIPAKQTFDPEALYQPRPEVSLPQSELGKVTTENPSPMTDTTDDTIGTIFTGIKGDTELGTVTVTTS